MAITTQTVKVDLNTGKVLPVVYAHQNDTNRAFVFEMYNNGVEYSMTGATVKFGYKSPVKKGAYFVITGTIMASGSVSGNTVTLNVPESYLKVSGEAVLTMIISNSSASIRPINIKMVVQSSADGDDVVEQASDFPVAMENIVDEWMQENVSLYVDKTLSIEDMAGDAKATGDALAMKQLMTDDDDYLYLQDSFTGSESQVIQLSEVVGDWLDAHPEATTTVQDGVITEAKLNTALVPKVSNNSFNFCRFTRELRENDENHLLNGGCIIDASTYLLFYVSSDNDNTVTVQKYDRTNHAYTTLGTITAGHCDSVTYDPDSTTLWVAPSSHWVNGSETAWDVVLGFKYPALSLDKTLNVSNIGAVGYDRVSQKLYGYTKSYGVVEINKSSGATTAVCTIDGSYASSHQGMAVQNGLVYLSTAFPNNIRVADLSGNIRADIPVREEYDYYLVGELEWVDVLDDALVLGSCQMASDASVSIMQMFETNLKTNIAPRLHVDKAPRLTAYVDASSTAYNPDGRSDNCFSRLEEALLYTQCCPTIDEVYLYAGEYSGKCQSSVSIYGVAKATVTINDLFVKSGIVGIENVTMKAMTVARSGNVFVKDCDTSALAVTNLGTVDVNTSIASYTGQVPISRKPYSLTANTVENWTIVNYSNIVRCGMCQFKYEVTFSTSGTASTGYVTLFTGLPKPFSNLYFNTVDNSGNRVKVRIKTNGEFAVNNAGASTSLGIDNTLVYPVNPVT